MDCSLPGSSIHGIFQARVLEWGAIAFLPCLLALPSLAMYKPCTFSEHLLFSKGGAAGSARQEACKSGALPPVAFLPTIDHRGTHLGASLERDAGRERVHYPRTKASSAQPFAPGPEGSELPANPLTCGCTRFAQVTAEGRVPDAAGLSPEQPTELEHGLGRNLDSTVGSSLAMPRAQKRPPGRPPQGSPRCGPRFSGLHSQ